MVSNKEACQKKEQQFKSLVNLIYIQLHPNLFGNIISTLNKFNVKNKIFASVGLCMLLMGFANLNYSYAQDTDEEDLKEQFPFAYNEDGQVKEYIDCKPEGESSTDLYGNEMYVNTGTVNHRIETLTGAIEGFEILNSDGKADDIIQNLQRELDCLEDVRSVKTQTGNL